MKKKEDGIVNPNEFVQIDSDIELISAEELNLQNVFKKLNIVSAKQLLDMQVKELPYLIPGLLPKYGVVALCGSSDTGKSSFLRQLGISVASKKPDFLGFPINATYNRAIYITTEDGLHATAHLLDKVIGENRTSDIDKNLCFVFDTYNLLNRLSDLLKTYPADLIILDACSDIIQGDVNSINVIRGFLQQYNELANQFELLILFLHHTAKRTELLTPSKNSVIGSQGFEGKIRLLLLLVKDPDDPSARILCPVKGNYISEEEKSSGYKLNFEDMVFTNLNERVPYERIGRDSKKGNTEIKAKVVQLHKDDPNLSVRMIADMTGISKSAVSNHIREDDMLNPESEVAEAGFPDVPEDEKGEWDHGDEDKNDSLHE